MRIVIRRNNAIFPILPYCISSLQCTNKYYIFDINILIRFVLKTISSRLYHLVARITIYFYFCFLTSQSRVSKFYTIPQKAWKIPITQSYLLYMECSSRVYVKTTVKLFQTPTQHQLLNWSTSTHQTPELVISYQYLHRLTARAKGPMIPRSQNRVCCLPRQLF